MKNITNLNIFHTYQISKFSFPYLSFRGGVTVPAELNMRGSWKSMVCILGQPEYRGLVDIKTGAYFSQRDF